MKGGRGAGRLWGPFFSLAGGCGRMCSVKVRAPGGAEGLTVGCEGIKGCQGDSRMSGLSHWMTERLLSDSGESRWCGGDGGDAGWGRCSGMFRRMFRAHVQACAVSGYLQHPRGDSYRTDAVLASPGTCISGRETPGQQRSYEATHHESRRRAPRR